MVHPTAGHQHKRVKHANINMHVVPLSCSMCSPPGDHGRSSLRTQTDPADCKASCPSERRYDSHANPPTQVRPGSVETKGQIKVTVITPSPAGKSYRPSSSMGWGVDNAFKAVASPSLALTECQHSHAIFKCDNHRYWDSEMKSFIRAKLPLLADSRSKHSLRSQKQTHGEALLVVRNGPNGHREMPSYGRKTTPETSGQEDVWAHRQWS